MSRGHLSCPRLAGWLHTRGQPCPAHSHGPERRLPFSVLRAARGEGPGRAEQYFSCSPLHKWNSIRKEETQARPERFKKTAGEKHLPTSLANQRARPVLQFPPQTPRVQPEPRGRAGLATANGVRSSPRPGSGPAVCGVRATTVPARRGGRQTRPTLPPPRARPWRGRAGHRALSERGCCPPPQRRAGPRRKTPPTPGRTPSTESTVLRPST